MRVMSYNIRHCLNSSSEKVNVEEIARVINECKADIVGLNEVLGGGFIFSSQVEKLSKLTGLSYSYFAKAITTPRGAYGNGVLSRYPFAFPETVIIPNPKPKKYNGYYETRSLLKVTLENGLTVLVSHFGLNPDERENAVDTVMSRISDKCILMGDFNCPLNDAVLDPVKSRMKEASAYIVGDCSTYPSDSPEMKIDHIFVTSDINVISSSVPDFTASDHRPFMAEINI